MVNQVPIPQQVVSRGQLVEPTDMINLTVQFNDQNGNPINTDTFPMVSIVSPSGLVILSPTSTGVSQVSTGKYLFQFVVPIDGPYGVFNDNWQGYVNGYLVQTTLSFVVSQTDLPAINSDGQVHIGDSPGLNFSQTAILNINKVIYGMKARLNSSGKAPSVDANGNLMYVDCDIFSIEMLTTFACMALAKFNQVPYFTRFTFEHTEIIDQFYEVITNIAWLYALASQALIERGREFQITDNSVNFNPPTVSELLETQYANDLTHAYDELKYIKNSIRPGPLGLGTFSMTSGPNPQIQRQRHLRERRIL